MIVYFSFDGSRIIFYNVIYCSVDFIKLLRSQNNFTDLGPTFSTQVFGLSKIFLLSRIMLENLTKKTNNHHIGRHVVQKKKKK